MLPHCVLVQTAAQLLAIALSGCQRWLAQAAAQLPANALLACPDGRACRRTRTTGLALRRQASGVTACRVGTSGPGHAAPTTCMQQVGAAQTLIGSGTPQPRHVMAVQGAPQTRDGSGWAQPECDSSHSMPDPCSAAASSLAALGSPARSSVVEYKHASDRQYQDWLK